MTTRYRKVPQTDTNRAEEERKKKRAERVEKITAKIHAVAWVAAAVAVAYYTDIFRIAFTDDRVNRYELSVKTKSPGKSIALFLLLYMMKMFFFFYDLLFFRLALNLAIICFVANMGIMLYLTLWLPLVMKVTAPWEIYCPHMIPTSTALGIICIILSMITFWDVWGMLTPLIVMILLMGFLFSAHFIPWPC
jgi:hypothetical protein